MGTLEIHGHQFFENKSPIFLQGMNLFLDSFRLEKDPKKIYTPPQVGADLIHKIIPYLQQCHLNCVRIWPTLQNDIHIASIDDEGINLLQDAGFHLIMNLPINWNLKPSLNTIKEFLKKYSPVKFPRISIYCINNECYHGFFSPHRYLDAVNHLTHRVTHTPTLVTNANLNFPKYFKSDIIGADFFTYRYSISSQGFQDVGAVAQMFLEDASQLYSWFPQKWKGGYQYLVQYLQKKAAKNNFDPRYFQQNLLKVLRTTQKWKKPFLVCEYGYTDEASQLPEIFAHMPIREMQGHIWYNWTNFDCMVKGKLSNISLFEKFKEMCLRLERIKVQNQ